MQSLVNYDTDEKTKIKDMWKKGREYFFNFDYTLTTKISKEEFEHNILNHYLMRRINYDTVTLFQIMLENRVTEVLPKYNMLWDCLDGWDVFRSGTTERTYKDTTESTGNSTNNTVDNSTITTTGNITTTTNAKTETESNATSATSDTPQGRITEVENTEYISEYNKTIDKSSATNNATTGNESCTTTGNKKTGESVGTSKDKKETEIKENVDKSVDNQAQLLITFMNEYNNIWTLLYRDLDTLFFGLV